ncbi:hypothetical protein [Streptomyces capillispiralis]|uniref:Small secreted domain DUF320 n=1 Tax=Streptomyces capillispiralis TaxID=68182 RepID=A0A561TK30_9ACTN|nr:hypothetical protein [Streptomyces capillispiralis]TWF87410.1 hypothetical protein FHX78_114418 [Streptomyces capillispiralis]GHH92666.1 hypothetical protein GCM10017779_31230 [Streptomyces capillispiralis]
MRKIQKAAVVVAMLGSVGALGAGTAVANDKPSNEFKVSGGGCTVEGDSVSVLSNIGVLNGGIISGILHFGEDQDGTTSLDQGHEVDCSTRGFTG